MLTDVYLAREARLSGKLTRTVVDLLLVQSTNPGKEEEGALYTVVFDKATKVTMSGISTSWGIGVDGNSGLLSDHAGFLVFLGMGVSVVIWKVTSLGDKAC